MHPGIPSNTGLGQASSRPPFQISGWQQLRVLVVEDHPAYGILLGWLVQKLGPGCEVFGDGQAALTAMALRHFDLVLSDCQMPVMDGYAMTREIRRRESAAQDGRVPIIALSASLRPAEIQRCIEAGMDDWRVKPLTLEQLHEVLESWLPNAEAAAHDTRHRSTASWPTRASLIETFGSGEVVQRLLTSLVHEAQKDLAALVQTQISQDAEGATQHLHRLVGSVAFLGDARLEYRGRQLIAAVTREGVAANSQSLRWLHQEMCRYLTYLKVL